MSNSSPLDPELEEKIKDQGVTMHRQAAPEGLFYSLGGVYRADGKYFEEHVAGDPERRYSSISPYTKVIPLGEDMNPLSAAEIAENQPIETIVFNILVAVVLFLLSLLGLVIVQEVLQSPTLVLASVCMVVYHYNPYKRWCIKRNDVLEID